MNLPLPGFSARPARLGSDGFTLNIIVLCGEGEIGGRITWRVLDIPWAGRSAEN
jgi:hypothetical protein